MLVDKALKKGQINTPDELSLAFKLQILSGSERGPLAISSWKGESVLDTANLPRYRGILRESSAEDPALFSTWHPEPHPLWDTLFSVYFGENESLKAWRRRVVPFVSLWQAVVENGYFKPSASNEHKFWGLQLLERSASMLDANNLGAVLTPNALKCVIANSTTKEKSLHKVALRVLAAFTKAAEIDSQAALVLMTNLTGKSGVMNFDKATRSKTIASIVAKLDVGPLTEYILYLQNAFLNPQKHGGAALGEEDGSADGGSGGRPQPQQSHEALVDSHRQWAMDQLLALVRNPQLPRREEWLARILRFFIVHGFYILVKDIPRSKVAEARIRPTPELSDKVQQGARERFFSVMGELNRMPLLTLDKKQAAPGVMPRRYLGVTESGELWAEVAVRTMIDDLDKQKHVQPLLTIEDSDTSKVVEEARKRAVGVAEGIRTRYKQIKAKDNEGAAKRCEQYRAFELLIWNLLLQLAAGEYEAAETLDEVCECYSKVLASDESAAKGHSGDRDEEQPIVVLVDVLVSFLAKPSNMLRKLTETVFTAFVSEMTLEALEVLTQVLLDKDGSVDDQGEEDDDTMEGDAGGQMGNGVRDSDAGDVSDDEDTSDDDGSDSEDKGQANGKLVPVDEELREKIREALGESAVMDENASEDEVLFDDEQMAVFDDKLTEIFSNKKVLKKEKRELQLTIQNFKLRILELANIFLSKQSSSPCVFKFISDLLSFSQIVEGNAKMRPLYDKVISIL
ncbi:DNA-directed DNA polymerase, partial [Spiromyces aspiralis]